MSLAEEGAVISFLKGTLCYNLASMPCCVEISTQSLQTYDRTWFVDLNSITQIALVHASCEDPGLVSRRGRGIDILDRKVKTFGKGRANSL